MRTKILDSAPIETAVTADTIEVFTLTGKKDWLNLIWSLKSFYRFAARSYPLTILDDGTLTNNEDEMLLLHFPQARLIRAVASDAIMMQELSDYPRCQCYRRLHPLARKCFDVGCFIRAPRVLLLDSDVLFFREPTELLFRIDKPTIMNYFNADVAPALNIGAVEASRKFNIELNERINSGLCLLSSAVFNLDWMEEFLCCDSIWANKIWRIEQTLLALAASRVGVELLPEREYRVSLQAGTDGCAAKHYVGAVRHLMYREGLAKLVRNGFLDPAHQDQYVSNDTSERTS
ncbi:MAG TPA: hypothetical protein VMJ32_18615 [Pirellulales bacterium]|nr:hypothetical protein [Pirellulales bacterium]